MTTRKHYLSVLQAKRRAKIKGRKFALKTKHSSTRFRRIAENNDLIISNLRAGH